MLSFAPDATAASSRWSATSNRIYVEGGGAMSLSDIAAATPGLPATALQHDPATGTWLLTVNIQITGGSELDLTSNDIKVLRLQSNPSSAPATDNTNFVEISADYGNIIINGITITSWDTTANAPDTNVADGRAYIQARSSQDPTTSAALESRMNIVNSDIGYLGWDASEAYGLSWKVVGNPGTNFQLYSLVHVYGNVTGSHIHNNMFGTYTFGLLGNGQDSGIWKNNEFDHDVGYGIDGHDDTNNVIIDSNNVHDNGVGAAAANHGIILSERCTGAKITNNTSTGNGGNGIMVHDHSDGALIQGNTATNNGDSGVAIFCTSGTQVKNNTLTGNANGLRLSVAADSNTIDGNKVTGSTKNGVYMFQGVDTNGICGSDLVPNGNTFSNNTIGTSATNGVFITEGYSNHFLTNVLNDPISIKNSTSSTLQTTDFTGNTFAPAAVLSLNGTASTPIQANISKSKQVTLHLNTGATGNFTDDAGAIFDLTRDLYVDVSGLNTVLDLTSSNAGTDFTVITRPLLVNSGSSTAHVAPTLWHTSGDYQKIWLVRSDAASNSIGYTVGDLQPGVSYALTRGNTSIGSFVADASGSLSFSDATGTTSAVTYTLTSSAPAQSNGGGGGGSGSGGAGALDPRVLITLLLFGALAQLRRRYR